MLVVVCLYCVLFLQFKSSVLLFGRFSGGSVYSSSVHSGQNQFMGVTWFKKATTYRRWYPAWKLKLFFHKMLQKEKKNWISLSKIVTYDPLKSMFPQQPVLNWLQITDPENISRKKCHYFFKPFAQLNIVENVFLFIFWNNCSYSRAHVSTSALSLFFFSSGTAVLFFFLPYTIILHLIKRYFSQFVLQLHVFWVFFDRFISITNIIQAWNIHKMLVVRHKKGLNCIHLYTGRAENTF